MMKRWFVVNTKPRNEERAATNLLNGGFEVIAPKLKLRRYKDGRFIHVIEEMFPGYIFVKFHPIKDFHLIKYTRGVKTIVHFGNRIVPVHDDVINFIRSKLRDGIAVLEKKRFNKGERVLIKDGPFKGLSGIFEKELDGKERVMILLDSVKFSLTMEIDHDLIASA
ncbi:MAG: transcriptional activator RfaH [Syntrophorhabdaceae bacterium]|nr:transcriptional activator RfaH [Syntrophorhabdaceae bacterium]